MRLCLPLQRVWVQSLVRELGSHVPHGLGARAWSRGDIVVNSVETLKRWSTSKEKKRIVSSGFELNSQLFELLSESKPNI